MDTTPSTALSSTLNPSKRNELEHLFAEFAANYPKSTTGKEHIASYRKSGEEAQRNYANILKQVVSGEDVTNDVLLKLLPYANSASNRWKGAWIHHAPAITGDIRIWYEAAGWSKASDWSPTARVILDFVQRCVDHPAQLADACRDFTQSPYSKGFQCATLTPILHALRPNDFLLVNNRVRHTLNYFTRSAFIQSLSDYPAANAALHSLIEELADFLQPFAIRRLFVADLFDMFCHWLVTVKKMTFRQPRYWRLALNEDIWQWQEWQEGNFVAIGYDDIGDASALNRSEFERLRNSLVTQHLDWSKREVDQVWRFSRQISEGDHIAVELGDKAVLGRGIVAGDYYFVPEIGYGHRLPVVWENDSARTLTTAALKSGLVASDEATWSSFAAAPAINIDPFVVKPTVSPAPVAMRETRPPYTTAQSPEISDQYSVFSIQSPVTDFQSPISALQSPVPNLWSLADCAAATFLDEALLQRWINAIERKGQAIFYGPPGVGKTFIATQLARHLSLSPLATTPDTVPDTVPSHWEMIQFHPAYEYEDFVQGIRPITSVDGLSYAVVPGRFLEFCHKAEQTNGRCVLIIDEINRANLGRVFGELMYLLEYRDQALRLAADGSSFRIPSNVRILATMNTADRSIALVDHALRRRFAFIHLPPNFDVLRRYHTQAQTDFAVEALIGVLQRLNQHIEDENYLLGVSYFLRANLASEIESIWQLEIEPYLAEFFFDQPDEVENWRWERVKGELGF